ncbi:MAG TPA: MFS transporter [Propionibacteriaceae bacterium]|nr:MFS transporter [Propionibacteriaceae bacterium]
MTDGALERTGTFASIVQVPNYRLFFIGALVSNSGGWVARVAQDWLVLTELTPGSATALGLVTTLQMMWLPLLSPWTGTVADRFPKRRLLLITQTCMTIVAGTLAWLVLSGHVQLWHVYVLAAAQGIVMAFEGPARMSFASELVPPRLLMNAISLNSAQFNSARLVGPAVGGLLIAAWGVGVGLLVNAVSFAAVIIALLLMRSDQIQAAPPRRGKGALREAVGYVKSRPDLLVAMAIVSMMATFAMTFQVTTALMATTVFNKGATEFGLLGSVLGVGSLAGALLSARRSSPRMTVLLVGLAGTSVSLVLMAAARDFWLFTVVLLPAGLCALTVLTTTNTIVQLNTDPSMRGRVMALYMAVNQGSMPLGALFAGYVSEAIGVRWVLGIGAVMTALTFVVAATYLVRLAGGWDVVRRRYDPRLRLHFRRRRPPAEEE